MADNEERCWYVTREINGKIYAVEFVWPDEIEWSPIEDDCHIVTFTYEEACELAEDGLNTQVKQNAPTPAKE